MYALQKRAYVSKRALRLLKKLKSSTTGRSAAEGRSLSQFTGEQPRIAALALQQHILHLQVTCQSRAQACFRLLPAHLRKQRWQR